MSELYTKLRVSLKNNKYTSGLFNIGKTIHRRKLENNAFTYHGQFINRSHEREKLCIVLAGYKEFLYPSVMQRLELFIEKDIDVCIITSGKFSEAVDELCRKNEWSYLSTKENNVALVQNVAIHLHEKAKYIFKLDEDMFITKDYFSKMMEALVFAKQGPYNPGVIAPLIPLNGYGNYTILEKCNLIEEYKERFETPTIEAGQRRQIENNPDVAEYMWSKVDIDRINESMGLQPLSVKPCAIRFSIGAILFERSLWEDMKYFPVKRNTTAMGADEAFMNKYCNIESRPIMVSENVVVGHFSFGPQTEAMKKFYRKYPERFIVREG